MFSNCTDGMKQDWIAVAILLRKDPSLHCHALDGFNMSVSDAFDRFTKQIYPSPSKSVWKLSRIVDMMDEDVAFKHSGFVPDWPES